MHTDNSDISNIVFSLVSLRQWKYSLGLRPNKIKKYEYGQWQKTIFNGKSGLHTCLNQGLILAFYTVGQLLCWATTIISLNIVKNRPAVRCKYASWGQKVH